jgi:signal transduction histidine kinase
VSGAASDRFRTSLRGRLLTVVLCALAPALLFVLWGANRERTRTLDVADAEGHLLLRTFASGYQASLGIARRILGEVAAIVGEKGGAPDATRCDGRLAALRRVEPRFASLLFASPGGAILCSAPDAAPGVTLGDRPYFRRTVDSGRPQTGEFQIGRVSGKPSLAFAVPVADAGGRLRSVAVASIDLDWLGEMVAKAPPPEGWDLYLLDRRGTILAHHPGQGRTGEPLLPATRFFEETRGWRSDRFVQPAGVPEFYLFEPLQGDAETIGVLALRVPTSILYEPAERSLVRQLVMLGLVAAISLAGVWFVGDVLMLSRMKRLVAAARRLGAGDLSARSGLPRERGELGELASALDEMAAGLEANETERNRAAEELRRSNERLRALTGRLETLREEEAIRIAREIHDDLGQSLTGLKMDLGALERSLPDAARAAASSRIRSMGALVDGTVETVRKISGEIRPHLLDPLGLVAALEFALERFGERTGVATRLDAAAGDEGLDARRATALFRIFQEALTNVARHAGATRVTATLDAEGGDLVLRVTDDGKGVGDADLEAPAALGILGMQERARAAGGSVSVERAPGRGTQVVARVPRQGGEPPA